MPELLGCSIGNKLDHNVKYFLSLGISIPQLGEMVSDFPMLLRYNIDVLRPKYRYLRRVMVRPLQDVIEFPRLADMHESIRVCTQIYIVDPSSEYQVAFMTQQVFQLFS